MRVAAARRFFGENRQANVVGRVNGRVALLFGQRGIAEKGAAGSWGQAGPRRSRHVPVSRLMAPERRPDPRLRGASHRVIGLVQKAHAGTMPTQLTTALHGTVEE